MTRIVGLALMLLGAASTAVAQFPQSPEIDPGSVGSALALLAGVALVIRGRRRN